MCKFKEYQNLNWIDNYNLRSISNFQIGVFTIITVGFILECWLGIELLKQL